MRGNSNGAVGVCFCGQLNVIYWWRAVAVNILFLFVIFIFIFVTNLATMQVSQFWFASIIGWLFCNCNIHNNQLKRCHLWRLFCHMCTPVTLVMWRFCTVIYWRGNFTIDHLPLLILSLSSFSPPSCSSLSTLLLRWMATACLSATLLARPRWILKTFLRMQLWCEICLKTFPRKQLC